MLGADVIVSAPKKCAVVDRMVDRQALVFTEIGFEEVDQHLALAIPIARDLRLSNVASENRIRDPARARPQGLGVVFTQVRPQKVLVDPFRRAEVEKLVLDDLPPRAAAELFALEVRQRCSVRSRRRESLKPLILKQAAVKVLGPGLGDHIHHPAASAAKLRVGAAGNYLEFPHGLERDVHSRALTARLFSKEAVVVVAAIERNVVENASLSIDVDLIAVRPLRNAHARSQCEQIFKLPSQHRRGCDRYIAEGRAG